MKIDPYKNKEKYLKWKEKVSGGIPELTRANSDLILGYIDDMEQGINISNLNIKGPRSYTRKWAASNTADRHRIGRDRT